MQSIILSFWCVICSIVFVSGTVEYSNRWTVQIDGDVDEADRLARKHGFVNLGKVTENYFSFQHHGVEMISKVPSGHLHQGLMSEPSVKMVEQQEMKSYKLLSSSDFYKPNDPEFDKMWYINRSDGPTYNVIDVWKRNITGQGVVVAVVDEGFNPTHPEIAGNFDKTASFDFIDNDTFPVPKNKSVPQYGHGDKCAGVIAAVLNNSECGIGLAYKAKLGGIRLFFDELATDDLESRALSHESNYVDIYSNSWGPDDRGFEVTGPGFFTKKALVNGAEHGRNGLGSIFVFAAGNGGLIVKDSCALNGYVNSIYTIAITGINKDGSIPIYGERCAGIMAVTYSRDIFNDDSKVITADTDGKCTESFGASSASAAMASGLIALMLSANRKLTWRDVQHIIAWTATTIDPVGIKRNKVGLGVHDYVGFGLMDASKMVDAALNWTSVPEKCNCTVKGPDTNMKISSEGATPKKIDLSDWKKYCGDEMNYLEHVEVHVNLTYSRRGDLLIKLESAEGTVSSLTHYRPSDSFFKFKDLDWVLMTLHFWGENPIGEWKLLLENSQPNHVNEGYLFSWELTLHGTFSDPLADNPHVARPRPVNRPTGTPSTQKPSRKPSGTTTTTDNGIPTVAADKFPTLTMKSDKTQIELIVGVGIAIVVVVVAIAIGVVYKRLRCRHLEGSQQCEEKLKTPPKQSLGQVEYSQRSKCLQPLVA